ncbi:WD repeat-containing protein 43 [Balamuthia mandrillaris]
MGSFSGLICGFDPNFERFALISSDNRLKIWDVASSSLRQSFTEAGHLNTQFSTLCWGTSPEKKGAKANTKRVKSANLALGTVKGFIVLLRDGGGSASLDDGQNKRILGEKGEGHSSRVNSLAFNKAGTFLFSCSNDTHVIQWNVETGQIIAKFQADKQPIRRLALSPDGTMLVTAATTLKVWDLSTHKVIKKFTGHARPVSGVALSANKHFILSTGGDRFLSLWSCDHDDASGSSQMVLEENNNANSKKKKEESNDDDDTKSSTVDATKVFTCPNNIKNFTFLNSNSNNDNSSSASRQLTFLAVLDSGQVAIWNVDRNSLIDTENNKSPKKKKAKQDHRPKTQTANGFIKLALPPSPDDADDTPSTSTSSSSSSSAIFVPPSEAKKQKPKKTRPPPRPLTAKIFNAQFVGSDEIILAHGTASKPFFERVKFVDKETGQVRSEMTVTTFEDATSTALLADPTTSIPPKITKQGPQEVSVLGAADMQLPSPTLFDEKQKKGSASAAGNKKEQQTSKANKKASSSAADEEPTLQEKLEMLELANGEDGDDEDDDLRTASQIRALSSLTQHPPIPSGDVPKAESLQAVLVQALHTNDKALLESVLAVSDETVIANTVQRLPTNFVLPFLTGLVSRFRAKPNRGVVLMQWVRAVLIQHSAFLMTLPNLAATLSSLYQTIDTRISAFKRFLKLSGRLDLLLSQIEEKERTTSLSRSRPSTIYNEDEDDEDMEEEDMDEEDEDEDEDEDEEEEEEEEEEDEEENEAAAEEEEEEED